MTTLGVGRPRRRRGVGRQQAPVAAGTPRALPIAHVPPRAAARTHLDHPTSLNGRTGEAPPATRERLSGYPQFPQVHPQRDWPRTARETAMSVLSAPAATSDCG